jgi:S1-C subfamily serine protease
MAAESTTAAPVRAIPADNLAYPVLITLKNGSTGSGFYISTGQGAYLVTAKHVLFDPKTNKLVDVALDLLSYAKDPSDSKRNLATLDLSVLQHDGNIKPHPSEDVAVIKISTSTNTGGLVPGVTFSEMATGGVLYAQLDTIRPFDQVLAGNDVIVFGYPTSVGLKELPQIDSRRPLLRKGIVAGVDPEKHSIILDCPSYPGNSGGPVVEINRVNLITTEFSIIGVVIQYVPFANQGNTFLLLSNSGYSLAAPMNFVLDLVK